MKNQKRQSCTKKLNKKIIQKLVMDHVSYPPSGRGGTKEQGSNSIMSTPFALKLRSNKIIDVDIILSFAQFRKVAHFNLWRKKIALK